MPTLLRNPFRKQDENIRISNSINGTDAKGNGTSNAKPVDVADQAKEPTEYKLSGENDFVWPLDRS
jgi:hypothetical protein